MLQNSVTGIQVVYKPLLNENEELGQGEHGAVCCFEVKKKCLL